MKHFLISAFALLLAGCTWPNDTAETRLMPEPKTPFSEVFDRANPAQHWNSLMLVTFAAERVSPPEASRLSAIMNTALLAAATGARGFDFPYETLPAGPDDLNAVDAANAAGRFIMAVTQPDLATMWRKEYALVADGAHEPSAEYGEKIAKEIYRQRVHDGASNSYRFTGLGTKAGRWRVTAPYFEPGLLPNWPHIKPFALPDVKDFRAAEPPAWDSDALRADYENIEKLGGAESQIRTADQEEIARFWADGKGTYTPPGSWLRIALAQLNERPELDLAQQLRVMAVLSLALADAGIACWESKYHYQLWRPLDAINYARGAAYGDENYWLSYLENPNFPEYPSGHSAFSAAAATVLGHFFGDDVAFTATSLGEPGVERAFTSFRQAAQEAADSRLYGGIHYSVAAENGLSQGRAVGQYVLENALQPLQ